MVGVAGGRERMLRWFFMLVITSCAVVDNNKVVIVLILGESLRHETALLKLQGGSRCFVLDFNSSCFIAFSGPPQLSATNWPRTNWPRSKWHRLAENGKAKIFCYPKSHLAQTLTLWRNHLDEISDKITEMEPSVRGQFVRGQFVAVSWLGSSFFYYCTRKRNWKLFL